MCDAKKTRKRAKRNATFFFRRNASGCDCVGSVFEGKSREFSLLNSFGSTCYWDFLFSSTTIIKSFSQGE
jgi:hypothetical protein